MRIIHSFDKETPFGGDTVVIEQLDGKVFVGFARCNICDQYNKKVGVKIAKDNLIKVFDYSRENNSDIGFILHKKSMAESDWMTDVRIAGFYAPMKYFGDLLFYSMINPNNHFCVLSADAAHYIKYENVDIDFIHLNNKDTLRLIDLAVLGFMDTYELEKDKIA